MLAAAWPLSTQHSLPTSLPTQLPAHAGSNSENQLGPPSEALANSSSPVLVGDASLAFTAVAAGDAFSCGLLANGSAACWGGFADNSQGQLLPAGPRLVAGYTFASLAAKRATLCGVTADSGDLVCAGGCPLAAWVGGRPCVG